MYNNLKRAVVDHVHDKVSSGADHMGLRLDYTVVHQCQPVHCSFLMSDVDRGVTW